MQTIELFAKQAKKACKKLMFVIIKFVVVLWGKKNNILIFDGKFFFCL